MSMPLTWKWSTKSFHFRSFFCPHTSNTSTLKNPVDSQYSTMYRLTHDHCRTLDPVEPKWNEIFTFMRNETEKKWKQNHDAELRLSYRFADTSSMPASSPTNLQQSKHHSWRTTMNLPQYFLSMNICHWISHRHRCKWTWKQISNKFFCLSSLVAQLI